jgi:hypothetical protein
MYCLFLVAKALLASFSFYKVTNTIPENLKINKKKEKKPAVSLVLEIDILIPESEREEEVVHILDVNTEGPAHALQRTSI